MFRVFGGGGLRLWGGGVRVLRFVVSGARVFVGGCRLLGFRFFEGFEV